MMHHFAGIAAIALERAKMTRSIILRMISMAELHDPKETGAHVNRVGSYAVEIYENWARRRKIPREESDKKRDVLRMAAMLHDVGKIATSDMILKKPGRLSDEEFEIMKLHTVHGARLFLDKQSEFDEIASEVAMTHHENWDGTGYPGQIDMTEVVPGRGLVSKKRPKPLKGDIIPLMGRIVSLADVYDALSCRRVYKDAWVEADVLKEIERCRGSKFDPDLVAVAIKHLTRFCRTTNINLAGFDAIFSTQNRELPLFLEINYFFGRRGLGGSEKYYQILETEIKQWLDRLGLSVG